MALAMFGVLAAGCTESGVGPEASPSVKAPEVRPNQACPGLITDAAGEALTDVLQSSQLVNDDAQTIGVTAMGKALEAFYRSGPKAGEFAAPSCTVTGTVGRGKRVGEIRLVADGRNAVVAGSDRTTVRVTRTDRERGVAFDCASTRVGATRDLPLRITASYMDRYESSRGDAVLSEDYVVLAHSAAAAIAKELGCENNGGLPERASDLPRP
ncbi:hypothetical protein AB0D97_17420 [Streptomyces roseus]|uniref:hypothetical protein n=1 Tax=Streptomyces roseus TaxID=66430 RepID=UPI0033D74D30